MWRSLWLLVLVFAGAASAAGAGEASADGPRVYQEEFHLRADRRFRLTTWREMSPASAGLLVESGCRALGFACSDEATDRDESQRYLKRMIVSGDYKGTARITRVRKESYYAKFVAPKGFTVCRAGIFLKSGSITQEARFGGSIQRSGLDGLGVYADLGRDAAGTGGIEFRLLIQYVPRGEAAVRRCWPDLTVIFLCRGSGDCRASRSYPETDLR